MVNVGASILIAVATAIATIGLNEGVRFLRDRAAVKKLAADWTVTWLNADRRIPVRVAIVENVGAAKAFNVDLTITGDAQFHIHPDAPLHECRPRDAILVMVSNAGSGVFKIDWTNAQGINQGPVFRFPGP